jgi:hypothetical protein
MEFSEGVGLNPTTDFREVNTAADFFCKFAKNHKLAKKSIPRTTLRIQFTAFLRTVKINFHFYYTFKSNVM